MKQPVHPRDKKKQSKLTLTYNITHNYDSCIYHTNYNNESGWLTVRNIITSLITIMYIKTTLITAVIHHVHYSPNDYFPKIWTNKEITDFYDNVFLFL